MAVADWRKAKYALKSATVDARYAMKKGLCLVAGTRIDHGYVAYGKLAAIARTKGEAKEAEKLLKALKQADKPFERRCVRQRATK